MAQIVWSEPALQDLEQIADYIALEDPTAANKLVQSVFQKLDLLETFPEMCSVPRDLPTDRYRHLIVGPLRIFHRIDGETIYVVYVMRAERNLNLEEIIERDAKR